MNAEPTPTPDEARVMLDRVGQLGASASAGASWAHIATLLTLGSATAMGTLALGVTTGAAFVTVMVVMLVWVIDLHLVHGGLRPGHPARLRQALARLHGVLGDCLRDRDPAGVERGRPEVSDAASSVPA